MSKIIDLSQEPVTVRWTFADVDIEGRQLELASHPETGEPMVIDWRSERAWIGPWDELIGDVAEQLRTGGHHAPGD